MSTITLSPAHAGSWVKCPAYMRLPYDLSKGNNRYEGLALHDVAAQALKDPSSQMQDYSGSIQLVQGEQVVITPEMLSRVKIYIDYMRSFASSYIESKIHCGCIHDKCNGKIDGWSYIPETHHLIVADYKDGRIEVSPFENWQLICYVAALIYKHFRDREYDLKVSMVIIQPRSREIDKIKYWTVNAPELRGYINILTDSAHNRLSDSPRSCAGEQCRYCSRKTQCTSYNVTIDNLLHACEYVDQLYDQGERLKLLQFASKMISISLDAEEAQALVDLKSGKSIKGFTVGKGRGSWTIKDEKGVDAVAKLFGVDVHKPKELITATQIMNAGVPKEYLEPYTERIPGKSKLIPINEKNVRKIFGE